MSIGTEPKIEKAAKKSAAKKPSRHVRGHRRAIWGLRRCRSCVWARGTWKGFNRGSVSFVGYSLYLMIGRRFVKATSF